MTGEVFEPLCRLGKSRSTAEVGKWWIGMRKNGSGRSHRNTPSGAAFWRKWRASWDESRRTLPSLNYCREWRVSGTDIAEGGTIPGISQLEQHNVHSDWRILKCVKVFDTKMGWGCACFAFCVFWAEHSQWMTFEYRKIRISWMEHWSHVAGHWKENRREGLLQLYLAAYQ